MYSAFEQAFSDCIAVFLLDFIVRHYTVLTDLFFILRPGSVAVEFKLTFKRELKDEEALAPLKEGIKNGKMGSLTVDPESLKVKKNNNGNCSYKLHAIILLFFLLFLTKKLRDDQLFNPAL